MQAESVFAKPDILELNLCSIRGMGAPFVRPANNQHSCGKMQLQKLTRTEAAHLIPPNSFEFLPISRSSAKSAAKPIFLSGLCCGFPFLFFSASPRLRGEWFCGGSSINVCYFCTDHYDLGSGRTMMGIPQLVSSRYRAPATLSATGLSSLNPSA
jgi:hypothetical protein